MEALLYKMPVFCPKLMKLKRTAPLSILIAAFILNSLIDRILKPVHVSGYGKAVLMLCDAYIPALCFILAALSPCCRIHALYDMRTCCYSIA